MKHHAKTEFFPAPMHDYDDGEVLVVAVMKKNLLSLGL